MQTKIAEMFPSSDNNGNVDPICYSDQQGYSRSFLNDITSNYKHDHQDQLLLPFFHLPNPPFSPWFEDSELQDHGPFFHQSHDLLLHQLTTTATGSADMDSNYSNDANNELIKICNKRSHNVTSGNEQMIKNVARKRTSKRDRHSKINTAQGPRDRRMRLSLKVAREFFDLQDKLCFDKASKTVEWLLIQARSAIKKLSSTDLSQQMNNYSCSLGTKSASSTSECEVVSGIDEAAIAIRGSKISQGNKQSSLCVNTGKKPKQFRRIAYHPLARESREKARARARERTREKQQSRRSIDKSKLCEEGKNHESNQLSCWNPFETTGEESGAQSHTMLADIEEEPISYHDQQQNRSLTAEGVIDDPLVIMKKWSPSLTINHLYNTSTTQETHYQIDLHSFCKSW